MTPRENYRNYFEGKEYEWTPCTFDMRPFMPEEIPGFASRGMVMQQNPCSVPFGGPDLFGVDWIFQPFTGGSIEKAPLLEDLEQWEEKVVFPDLDKIEWEKIAEKNKDYLNTDLMLRSTIFTGYFERLISFVGFENAAVALIDEEQEETIHRLFDRLTDFYIEYVSRMHRCFGIEMMDIHDDWGTQVNTIFSMDVHTEMILPHIKRLVTAAHEEGVFMEQHSCGKIDVLVPNIIESGMDSWVGQSIVDKPKLVEDYGDRFHFGVQFNPEKLTSDEEVMKFLDDYIGIYHGKDIWFFLISRTLTPAQSMMVYKRIREIGRI